MVLSVAPALFLTYGVASGPVVWADGDAKRGKKVFNKRKACHKLAAGKKKPGRGWRSLASRRKTTG